VLLPAADDVALPAGGGATGGAGGGDVGSGGGGLGTVGGCRVAHPNVSVSTSTATEVRTHDLVQVVSGRRIERGCEVDPSPGREPGDGQRAENRRTNTSGTMSSSWDGFPLIH
jgi:hypothetical protein